MYHYTYIIQHNTSEMRYIGVRSCKCTPQADTNYWGSSKHLPNDIKTTHTKIILATHKTREKAIEDEIRLHRLNNVANNKTFYNKARQLVSGFDTLGTKLPEFTSEHKHNLSKALLKYTSSSTYRNPRKGIEVLSSTKLKLKTNMLKAWETTPSYLIAPKFKPWFISYSTYSKVFYYTTKEEYAIECGLNNATFRTLANSSKGTFKIAKGIFKGLVVGNIDDAGKHYKVLKSPWFISYSNYTDIFYHTSMSKYERDNGLRKGLLSDCVFSSKGVKPLVKGKFKNCIIGKINIKI